jgi:acyl-CoA reductase-like NAD-dependent aldehyde dehydrogenase
VRDCTTFYVDGQWIAPAEQRTLDVINPATEAVAGLISLGGRADVDRAVAAAQRAFARYSRTTREQRMALLQAVIDAYKRCMDDMAQAISEEMGAPLAKVARPQQAPSGLGHFMVALGVLKDFEFERYRARRRSCASPWACVGSSRRGTGRPTRSPARSRRRSRAAARWF